MTAPDAPPCLTPSRCSQGLMETPDHEPLAAPPLPLWRIALDTRWEALRRAALGLDATTGHRLAELGRECEHLAVITAWFEAGGNITHAAARLRTNRKTFREHTLAWSRRNPLLVPPPRPERSKPRRRRVHEPKRSPP